VKKIPAYIVDPETRAHLDKIGGYIAELQKAHRELCEKLERRTITAAEAALLDKVIKAHNNLQKQWDALTPRLVEALIKKYEQSEG
jgi:hypothetical protein